MGERTSALKKMKFKKSSDCDLWMKVLIPEMMSSEESGNDEDDEEILKVLPLPERLQRCSSNLILNHQNIKLLSQGDKGRGVYLGKARRGRGLIEMEIYQTGYSGHETVTLSLSPTSYLLVNLLSEN